MEYIHNCIIQCCGTRELVHLGIFLKQILVYSFLCIAITDFRIRVLVFTCISLLLGLFERSTSQAVWLNESLQEVTSNVKSRSFEEVTSNVKSRSYICATCGKQLESSSGFRRHMLIHGEKLYTCSICLKTFTERNHFEGHVNVHINLKPFDCQKCRKTFSYKTSLNRHKIICHGIIKKEGYMCHICSMRFVKKDALKDHIKGKHEPDGFYTCSICGKGYKWRASRSNHMKMHHHAYT